MHKKHAAGGMMPETDKGHEGDGGGEERKRGGAMPEGFKHHDAMEHKAAEKKTHKRRARGGGIADEAEPGGKPVPGAKEKAPHQARKRGGAVHGAAAKHRPDRRARGGATSDADPLTSAGKMTSMPFERGSQPKKDTGGTARESRSD